MSELPKGWRRTTIGDACQIVGGSTPKTSVPGFWGGDIAWITPDDLSSNADKYIEHGARFITESGYNSCSTQMLPAGSVIFSSRAPIGYTVIASRPICTNQGFKSFIPSSDVISDYLYWYLRFATPRIQEMGSGTTFRELSARVAKSIPLILPPISEQHSIVARIEAHLDLLEIAKGLLRRCRRNLANLQESILRSAFSQEAPHCRLSEVCEKPQYGWTTRSKSNGDSLQLLRITDIRGSSVDWSSVPHCENEPPDRQKFLLEPGDILVARSGATVGKSFLIRSAPPSVFASYLIRIRTRKCLLPEYLALFFNSTSYWDQIASARSGIAQPNVNATKLGQLKLPVPSVADQQSIVRRAEEQFLAADSTDQAVNRVLSRAAALRMCVLRDAFAGRLSPCKPADKPASAFVEHVQTESKTQ